MEYFPIIFYTIFVAFINFGLFYSSFKKLTNEPYLVAFICTAIYAFNLQGPNFESANIFDLVIIASVVLYLVKYMKITSWHSYVIPIVIWMFSGFFAKTVVLLVASIVINGP